MKGDLLAASHAARYPTHRPGNGCLAFWRNGVNLGIRRIRIRGAEFVHAHTKPEPPLISAGLRMNASFTKNPEMCTHRVTPICPAQCVSLVTFRGVSLEARASVWFSFKAIQEFYPKLNPALFIFGFASNGCFDRIQGSNSESCSAMTAMFISQRPWNT